MAWNFKSDWAAVPRNPAAADLDNIAKDLRTKGGNTDYAGYNLSNLGVLTFAAGGYLSSDLSVGVGNDGTHRVTIDKGLIGSNAGNEVALLKLYARDATGYDTHIRAFGRRHTAGSDWAGVGLRLQFKVQAANMAYIEFNPTSGVSSDLAFGYGTSEWMRITATGNVGIGTTSPASKLHVVGIPSYADNAAAIAGGLTAGAFYHTSGALKVVI